MPAFSPPTEPGFHFKDGKLNIFRDDAVMQITGWPEPSAIRKSAATGRWEAFDPEFRLVKPYRKSRPPKPRPVRRRVEMPPEQMAFDFFAGPKGTEKESAPKLTKAQERKRAFDQFRFSLPKEIAKALEPFQSHQWPLLLLLRYDESALDLVRANPALGYLLAQRMGGDREMIRTLKCGTLRQKEILGCLDFPETNGEVKLFRKVDPASVNGDNWQGLLGILRRSDEMTRQKLSHVPRINTGVASILLSPEVGRSVGQHLLNEVAGDPGEKYRARVERMVIDTLRMQEEMRSRDPVTTFPNRSRLEEVHARVGERYREVRHRIDAIRREGTDNFSRPPLPALRDKIEPIVSPEGLAAESEEQGNCVSTYARRVRRGDTFIYRVFSPERCTLSIVRSPGGDWKIGELEARFNTGAKPETRDFVQAWVDRYRLSV